MTHPINARQKHRGQLIVIPFHLPWDRPADYQRQTCLELAKTNAVLAAAELEPLSVWQWLRNGLRQQSWLPLYRLPTRTPKPIFWFRPLTLIPGRRFESFKMLNLALNIWLASKWIKYRTAFGRSQEKPLLWLFDPMFVGLLGWLTDWPNLYDCVDFHQATDHQLTDQLIAWETDLIRQTDYFFVNSNALATTHTPIRPPSAIVVQGFAQDSYKGADPNLKISRPTQFDDYSERPIVGFMGAIGYRLDYGLLQQVIKKQPNWHFVFCGPVEEYDESLDPRWRNWQDQFAKLRRLPNVTIQDPLPKNQLFSAMGQWSVGIIPYNLTDNFNKYCFPMKLFEYFYAGLPVVATPVFELKWYTNFVTTAQSAPDFIAAIKNYIHNPWPTKTQRAQRKLAESHSYANKVATIFTVITPTNSSRS